MSMNKEFQVHMLNDAGKAKAAAIAVAFDECLTKLITLCAPPANGSPGAGAILYPQGTREMAIVRTKLEEACFFAKKAMASSPENGVEMPSAGAQVNKSDKRLLARASRAGGTFASYRYAWEVRAARRLTRAGRVVCAVSKCDHFGGRPVQGVVRRVAEPGGGPLPSTGRRSSRSRNAGAVRWK